MDEMTKKQEEATRIIEAIGTTTITTDVTINIVELASNLAHNAMFDELVFEKELDEDTIIVPSDDDPKMTKYSDMAQEVFNRYYDYYYGEIERCKINE